MKKKVKRKVKRITKKTVYKWIDCNCGEPVEVTNKTTSVSCNLCTLKNNIKKYGLPSGAKPRTTKIDKIKRPRGWHFMNEYVDIKGNVFHKGIEQPKLKGTKIPTSPKAKKKKVKLNPRIKSQKFAKLSKDINSLRNKIAKMIRNNKVRGLKKLEKEMSRKRKELKKYL